jgi:hypothetical protein
MKSKKHQKVTPQKRERSTGMELLSWQAPSFRQVYRGPLWLAGMAVGVGLMIAFAIWQDILVLVITMILVALIYLFTHREIPEIYDYKLTNKAIIGPKNKYFFDDLAKFYVLHSPETHLNELHLIKKKGVQRDVTIQLGEMEPDELVSFLETQLVHDAEREEKLSEQFIRVLKL